MRRRIVCLGCTPSCYKKNCAPCYREAISVKLAQRKLTAIQPTNEAEVNAWLDTPLKDTPYEPLLRLWAQMVDMIAKGDTCYFIAGATRNMDALSLTMNTGADKESAYAPTLAELASEVTAWL